MGYKVHGRNVDGQGGREKLVDSGFKTLLRFSCSARRLAWSLKDSLGCDWLCSSVRRSGVAVGSQVTNNRNAKPKFTAPLEESPAIRAGLFLFDRLTPPNPHPPYPDLPPLFGQLEEGISPEAVRTANPVQTTVFSRVKMGFRWNGVDGENPFMMASGIGTILI